MPIYGTGAESNIKAVRTKLVNIFATKFLPDLDAGALEQYLRDKLGRVVQCNRIDTGNARYSSFKVSIECEEVAEAYNPEIWPVGSLVRRLLGRGRGRRRRRAGQTGAASRAGPQEAAQRGGGGGRARGTVLAAPQELVGHRGADGLDRKSTRLNSSH